MGDVIPFERLKKKENEFNPNKKNSRIITKKATKECPKVLDSLKEGSRTDVDYADMEPEKKIEYWKSIEKEEEERFREKYKDVLAAVGIQGLMYGWTSTSSILLVLILLTVTISKQTKSLNSHMNINLKKWQQKNWRKS